MYGFFQDDHFIYLVLEFAEKGELYQDLQKSKRFTETKTSKLISQVLSALIYIHDRFVIHRDIKPEVTLL